ncbi:MAG TPA: hypothetical protein VGJ43_13220 [Acidimicrobiales bacterium]
MRRLDVRRLAAIDMHGVKGGPVRARVIVAEFAFGALAAVVIAALTVASAPTLGWWLLSVWLVGVCLNYVPLLAYALGFLRRPDTMAAELAGVDIRAELRHYTTAQLWVLVPLALVVFTLAERA